MLLLAADTSGRDGSIALARCGPGEACQVIEVSRLEGGTFSAQLIPQIAALLTKHEQGKESIGAFAVASGPGSFTGLRVGLAAIKALAEVLRKPIAAVSLLEALLAAGHWEGKVVAALDAGRGEVYVGEYGGKAASPVGSPHGKAIQERLLSREAWLETRENATIVTPDDVIAQAATAKGLRVEQTQRPRSDAIAQLGRKKIVAGETVSAEALEANYFRRSDVELFSKSTH
jgi:tRNA threonylcarbamoyladenosine biosynthesis protein TsaB